MKASDATESISACARAFPDWASKPAAQRSAVLERMYGLMMENQADLAHIVTSECGKPLAEATGEIAYAASFLKWFAEEGKRAYGDTIPTNSENKRLITIKQPVGVCAAITPWNFPSAMITRKLGPALAAGCAMVIKPAEDTPLSALALANLAAEAGVPDNVIRVVTSERARVQEISQVLTVSDLVRKLSFTGSTAVGKLLMRESAASLKRMSLELGGNAPFIVFDDADLDAAVVGAMASKFRNSGQTCVCANRIYVQAAVYDKFAEKFSQAVAALHVGHGLEEGVTQGPLINQAGYDKAVAHIQDATARGAQCVVGGSSHGLGGTFLQPTVLTGVTRDMAISSEETFGPVAGLISFDTEAEVVALANDTDAGLAAYFYTDSLHRAHRVAEALEYGMVGINEGIISTEAAPFGGIKHSGFGREGGHEGLDEYLETKYLCFGGF